MELFQSNIGLLFFFLYLLPGFLGIIVYDYLSVGEKRDNFQKTIDALALTLVSILCVHYMAGIPFLPSVRNTQTTDLLNDLLSLHLFLTSLAAAGIAIALAICNNHGVLYRILKALKFTYKYSMMDVWQDTFYKHTKFWLIIRFADGRALVGWPKYYSETGKPRELFITNATWWERDAAGNLVERDVKGNGGVYVSDFSGVKSMELV